MGKNELENIIISLIRLKKEGIYWDFKQEYHSNSVDLVHDIICLANADYAGDKYIIFGVKDDYEIIGLDGNFKSQSDIIDTLRNAKFTDDVFPDIGLESISIENQTIDILIIKNINNKPYYLLEQKKKDKKIINAGTIYSRNMDTNTPKNRVASSKDIEHMWKERFGLTQTPLERFKIYLNDFNGWSHNGEKSFYKQHPEFTIQPLDNNYCQGNETLEWARGEIGYNYSSGNGTSVFGFYYHTTLMHTICCVQFDGGKKYIVNPDWEAIGKGRIYFYLEDSLEYSYQIFIINERKYDFSTQIFSKDHSQFDMPVFTNKDELEKFLYDVTIHFKINDQFITPEDNEDKQNELFYSYLEYYLKWSNYA